MGKMNDWSGSGPERITRSDILARNLQWTDVDRETLRQVLDAVSDRVDHAYRRQSYWALKPIAGTPRVPLFVHLHSVAVDRDIDLPADLAARAFPGSRGANDQYVIIEFSTARQERRAPAAQLRTERTPPNSVKTCPVHFVELPATGVCDLCE